jgi:hypothetical protein
MRLVQQAMALLLVVTQAAVNRFGEEGGYGV